MRPEDFRLGGSAPVASEEELPYPRSSFAKPPITAEEAKAAEHAICRLHHGHISHTRVSSDTDGKVLYCPRGRMYWRFTKQLSAFMKPLPYIKKEGCCIRQFRH